MRHTNTTSQGWRIGFNPFFSPRPAVVKEAASLKKYNLFTDSRDLLSQSSRSSLSSPSVSTPNSPAMALASPTKTSSEPQPASPLAVNGQPSTPEKVEKVNGVLRNEASTDRAAVIETPLGKVEQKEVAQSVAVSQEAEVPAPKEEDIIQTVTPAADESTALAATTNQSETQEVNIEAAPETVTQEKVISVQTEKVETAAEPLQQNTDAPKEAEITLSETPAVVEDIKIEVEAAAAQTEAPDSTDVPENTSAEGTQSQTAANSEGQTHCESSETELEAPSSGETAVLTPADLSQGLQEAEPDTGSDPNSLDVSVGSEAAPSDVESVEEVKVTQISEDEVSTTSDVLEDERTSKLPLSSDDPAEDRPAPQAQTEAVSSDIEVGASVEAAEATAEATPEATAEATAEATPSESSDPVVEETPSSPEAQALDSIKEIRDLVVEVIEVEELVQHYPDGVPKEE